jgi:hypothetical protein
MLVEPVLGMPACRRIVAVIGQSGYGRTPGVRWS